MNYSHENRITRELGARPRDHRRPTARTACCSTRANAREHGIPFLFDPGQGLPMFSGAELGGVRASSPTTSR